MNLDIFPRNPHWLGFGSKGNKSLLFSLFIFIVSPISEIIAPLWNKYLRSYLRIHLGKTSPFKKYRLGVWILHMRYFLPRPRSIKSLKWICQPPTHPVGKMSQVWPDYFFDGIKIKTIKNKMSNLNKKNLTADNLGFRCG